MRGLEASGLFWLVFLIAAPVATWVVLAWLWGNVFTFVERHWPPVRAKPRGYVGKFRRLDGEIVHVARLPNNTLMVASESQPPHDLGTVTGPELARWTKLASEPDA